MGQAYYRDFTNQSEEEKSSLNPVQKAFSLENSLSRPPKRQSDAVFKSYFLRQANEEGADEVVKSWHDSLGEKAWGRSVFFSWKT